MFFVHFTESPKPVVRVDPDRRVFSGETVTLTCDIQQTGDWQYSWYKDVNQVNSARQDKSYIITSVDPSHDGVYSCRGNQSKATGYSQYSAGVKLTVSGESSCVLQVQVQVQVELYCHSATCGDIQWNEMSCLTGPRCYINTDINTDIQQ